MGLDWPLWKISGAVPPTASERWKKSCPFILQKITPDQPMRITAGPGLRVRKADGMIFSPRSISSMIFPKANGRTFHTEFTRNSDGSIIPWQLSAAKHPYYGKLRTNPNNHFLSSMPVHVIRYAHVLLVYAEAQARAEGNPNPAAYAALNAVRERAELPP